MPEGVAGFGFRGVAKKTADIWIALDIRKPCEIQIPSNRLRIGREGLFQVVVTLPARQSFCHKLSSLIVMINDNTKALGKSKTVLRFFYFAGSDIFSVTAHR